MAHRSETTTRLRRILRTPSAPGLPPSPESEGAAVWLFLLPEEGAAAESLGDEEWLAALDRFCEALPDESVGCWLTAPSDAAALLTRIEKHLRYRLWVAVKRAADPAPSDRLPRGHSALLVFAKSRSSLRHALTRIGYTYCPACDRTTKDYGGKKHLYHEYGTLMSDVWRDIAVEPGRFPETVVERVRDLFGIEPYRKLHVVDLRKAFPGWGGAAVGHFVGTALSDRSDGSVGSDRLDRPHGSGSCKGSNRSDKSVLAAGSTFAGKAQPDSRNSRLLRGDCLSKLSTLPDDSVDFCFADPPYNINKKYDRWNDSLEIREYFIWCDRWLSELARVLKPGHTLAVLNIPLWSVRHFQHLKTILDFQAWIAWEGLSLPVRKIMPAHYAILCFSKGAPRALPGMMADDTRSALEMESLRTLKEGYCLRSSCIARRRAAGVEDTQSLADLWWDIHRLKHNSRRDDHPCQLPPRLMRRLIALFTREGETVLDPFNGIGTTTLCAAQLGRRYIGIELSKEYHALAKRRHALLDTGGNPFAKRAADAPPGVKNSRVQRLKKQKYAVTKKSLQLEIKRIAKELGRIPTREEVREQSRFRMEYYEEYFIDWGEATAAARTTGMAERRPDFRARS